MKKVLIVDQSQSFVQFITYVLSRLEYEVTSCETADEALGRIDDIMPELILAEANMKGLNGIELCARMKEKHAALSIPVAIISIDGTMETRQNAQKAGCVDYLTKPVTARAIHELMERHLPYHHKRHHIRARMNVHVTIEDGIKVQEMRTISIGEGGLYACTDQPRKTGVKLGIKMPLPSLNQPLELQGEVIYATDTHDQGIPMGMGIKFVGMDQNTVTLMRHYMESYLSDFLPESPSHE